MSDEKRYLPSQMCELSFGHPSANMFGFNGVNTHMTMIELFHRKRWALYHISKKQKISSLNELPSVIEKGKASIASFVCGGKYLILPEVEHDENPEEVMEAFESTAHGGPCYIEFLCQDPKKEVIKGKLPKMRMHPIDSVVLDENLHLIIDKERYAQIQTSNPNPQLKSPNIIIPAAYMETAIMHCINQYRTQQQRMDNIGRFM